MLYHDYTKRYVIDWKKVKTIDDIKRLIAAFDIAFEVNNPQIENIKDLVVLKDK